MPTPRFPSQPVSASLTLLMLGILGLVVLIDVGATSSGVGLFARVAYWSMAVGVVTGLVALTAQLVDVVTTPAGVPGRSHLGILSGGTTAMLVTFAATWWLRQDGRLSPTPVLVVEGFAFVVGLAAAVHARWFFAGSPPPRPAGTTPAPRALYRRPLATPSYRSRYGQTVPHRVTPYRVTPYRVTPVTTPYRPGETPTARLRPSPRHAAGRRPEPAIARRDRSR